MNNNMGEYTCEDSLNSFKGFFLPCDYIQGFGAFKLLYEYCLRLIPFLVMCVVSRGGGRGQRRAFY